jgi:putative heme-binding domain-containing protein
MTDPRRRSHVPGRAFLVLLTLLLPSLVLLRTQAPTRAADDPLPADKLALRPGDHVGIIGNTLADRMQHDGWLETYFHSRFPQHDLVFRDLGFSGDEVAHRERSDGFGSPDEWLTRSKADVVFAFFGYNESYAGEAGLDNFKKELDTLVKHTLIQKYNGTSAPRLVLFSPVAFENHHDRNLPDGSDVNTRLELYTAAMAEVARANHVPFVDLYRPTRELYEKATKPLTINGVHLTDEGDRQVAQVIDKALFGDAEVKRDRQALAKLRQAVLDKNLYFFNRYRTVDGYNIYGGRSYEKYLGITNREVMQREMEVLDVMTANRDKRVWAVAKGGDLKVDDSNTPPFVPVPTNKPGPGPDGTYPFLGGEEAIGKMTVARGMKVSLFASDEQIPDLAKPVQMAWDTQGRLWVAVWPAYPHWKPKDEMNDKILILEDTKGTGKCDKVTVFADHLNCPTGFAFYNGGVLVAQAPDVLFLKDTDGDGKADVRVPVAGASGLCVRVVDGIDSADSHHTANSFTVDPGGAVYWQEGVFHHSQVETPYGPPQRCTNAGVFRYEPRTQKTEVYASYGFANPHGHVFDRWGRDFVYDGTGANPYDGSLISGHLEYPQKHPHAPQVYQQRTRPCPGVEILSSRHFPPENQGNLLVANVIGFQGILQYKVHETGSSLTATEVEPIVYSSDPNFRPSAIEVGPDGALYFLDWQNPIIGHLQHHLRDPSRDHTHGRIYRITCTDRPLLPPVQVAGASIRKLLELLKSPEDRVRYRARIELGGRDSDLVMTAVQKWVAGLDPKDAGYQHHLTEALWLHQSHNLVDVDLLKRLLAAPEPHARAAATRVLCYWHDRVPDALDLLRKLAADPHPRVRLQAVRAASFFTVPEAIEVALISTEHPTDQYLDYVRTETMRALEPYVKKAIASGRSIQFTSTAGARYFLKNVGTDDLLKMKRDHGVYVELLFRPGVRDEYRREALAGLAKLEKKDDVHMLLDAIRSQDEQQTTEEESVVFDLVRLLTGRGSEELAGARAELEQMATTARLPVTRELGFVALVAADGNVDRAWALATKSVTALQDLVHAMPLIRDAGQRAGLYPKVLPLLDGLPPGLADGDHGKAVRGRYVRVELPGKRKTLTLAEVEVHSGGRNVARGGKATQSSTSNGGDASRAIDGNTSGKFGDGGQTHTEESTTSPWWQVDLGMEYPIDSVVIWNRTDSELGKRLNGFTLKVLDGNHKVVYQQQQQQAPEVKAAYEVGHEAPERVVRRAAIHALPSVRGQEAQTFKALARFVKNAEDRPAAVRSLQRIPAADWPKDEAGPLLDSLLAYVRKVPVQERTTAEALDALQLADALASLLPLAEAKRVRKELGELGVRVLRLGTVPEQMLYDRERLIVKAGTPFEVLFENNDLMPHNFVVTQPGALEEVGTLAETQATQPGAAERGYVPQSPKVLFHGVLLQPRSAEKLAWTAPTRPGVYPYVCTYPGHWRRMYGALYVVADLDEYLADPEGYLSHNPLPVADDLLKFTRPRKEWKFEELASSVEQMEKEGGRSFSNGKNLFQVASCVSCHKLNGVGNEIGPDLTKIEPKLQKPIEVLHDILEPSFRINEKFQSYVFEMDSGKVVTGLILAETAETVKVIENPLAKADPVVLKKAEIVKRDKSPTSIMPKGLLDKLTREEILDLVAYSSAGGNPKHPLFQGGHDHGHDAGHQHGP